MARHNFFTVDLGATSGRTILASFDGARMELTELTRFENPIQIGRASCRERV